MSGEVEKNLQEKEVVSHSKVFNTVTSTATKRRMVVETVHNPAVSLGMVDPTTGRSLLYKLLTLVTNGDKIVLDKLDSCVTTTIDDEDDNDFAVRIDHKYLVDEDPRNLTLVKDLLSLPRKLTSNILCHPVISTFVEKRWERTKNMFLLSFVLYLIFVVLYSVFLSMMYERNQDADDNFIHIPVQLPTSCDLLSPIQFADDKNMQLRGWSAEDLIDITKDGGTEGIEDGVTDRAGLNRAKKDKNKGRKDENVYNYKLEVIKEKKNKTRRTRANKKQGLFSECGGRKKFQDIPLCAVEALLLISIIVLLIFEAWQMVALGKEYFMELENWFELLILGLAISTLCLKAELDILSIVASIGICLAWIELIFLFGRYPSLGGSFNIMYYAITKRVIRTALGLILLVFAFALAFFIIHFNNSSEAFEDVGKSFVKSFVMVLGEFEFNDLWDSSTKSESTLSRFFTMLLLITMIVMGTIIMVNLIVAIIITDIEWLNKVSKQQVLRNQVRQFIFSSVAKQPNIFRKQPAT